jgi:hypothetical protein
MISAIDEALKNIIRTDALEGSADVEVVLDAPTKDWAARRNAPTVNLYLYDIREDLRRREYGWTDDRADGRVVARRRVPRYSKLSYLVTAWTKRPEDEHRLLAALMACFLHYDAMPASLTPPAVTEQGLPVPITVGLPPPEDRAFADVWTALGGELKPSLDVVVIAPMDVGLPQPAGGPVTDGTYIDMSDLIRGGRDDQVHHHRAPQPSSAATARLGGSSGNGIGLSGDPEAAPADGLALGKGRKPRNQPRNRKSGSGA